MIPTISAAEAHEHMQNGTPVIDVREDMEWAQGHVPGAVHVPLSQFMDHLKAIPKDQQVLIYCAVGGRSAQAAGWLNQNGYDAVNVAGGIQSWAASGLPIEPHS